MGFSSRRDHDTFSRIVIRRCSSFPWLLRFALAASLVLLPLPSWARFTSPARIFNTATNTITANLPATVSFTYDSNGNLTGDGRRTLAYDAENQLSSVTVTNVGAGTSTRTDFVHDGLRRLRVSKEYVWNGSAFVLAGEARRVFDGRLVIRERDANNIPVITYTRGLDLSGTLEGAGGIGGMLARTDHSSGTSACYHADGSGNVTMLINASQQPVARYSYDPFGNVQGKSGSLADANVYRSSSKEWHERTGLVYYGFRFYDPSLQRWVNQDPLGEAGGINLYGFVGNNAVGFIDPHGLFLKNFWNWWFHPPYSAPNYMSPEGTPSYGPPGDVIANNYAEDAENFPTCGAPSSSFGRKSGWEGGALGASALQDELARQWVLSAVGSVFGKLGGLVGSSARCESAVAKTGNETVTLYHHTSGQFGKLINQSGVLKGSSTPGLWRPWKTGDIYLSTKPELNTLQRLIYGLPKSKTEAVVRVTVPESRVVTRPFGIRIVEEPINLGPPQTLP